MRTNARSAVICAAIAIACMHFAACTSTRAASHPQGDSVLRSESDARLEPEPRVEPAPTSEAGTHRQDAQSSRDTAVPNPTVDAHPDASGTGVSNAPAPLPRVTLPADWASAPRADFSAGLERWISLDKGGALDDAALATLSRALGANDETSVRAAVILGRTRDPRAGERLLERLEARVLPRGGTYAGDVVAAAAFTSGLPARDAATRLEDLARGRAPHPVLDVRVECAAASLALGRDGAIPFLLDVLREGTPSASATPNWTRIDPDDPRMLRIQDRAARALSERAGIECAYRAYASIAARESEITRLSSLLANAAHTPAVRR